MQDILNEYIPNYRLATKTRRWFAAAVDYGICLVVWFVLAYAFGTGIVDEEGNVSYHLKGWPALLTISLPWFIIIVCVEAFNEGQTIGKAIFKLKVVKVSGDKADFGNIFARRIVDVLDYLPFFGIIGLLVASGTPNNKRVGDIVGSTKVISTEAI